METSEYTCVPSFTSMCAIHCLQTCNLIRCHGDDVVHMYTKFHIRRVTISRL